MELDPQLVDPICEGSIVQVAFELLVLCKFWFSLKGFPFDYELFEDSTFQTLTT